MNPQAGSNFSFGLGLGVGLEIRKKQKQETTLPAARAALRVSGFQLEFLGKDLIKEVTV